MVYYNLFSILLVIHALSLGSNGLKCYECEDCDDPFYKIDNKTLNAPDAKLVTCPRGYSTCIVRNFFLLV